MLYIACPYEHADPAVRDFRFRTACRASALLMKSGIVVFSPLSHSVPIALQENLGDSHDFWMSMDMPILERCDEVLVLGLDGWERSRGVNKEMFTAFILKKPVTVIGESDIDRLPAIPKTAMHYFTSSILTEVYDVR